MASDPSAARCLLGSQAALRWVPLNVAVGVQCCAEEIERFRLAHRSSVLARTIAAWLSHLERSGRHGAGAAVPDAVAVVLAIDPSLGQWRLRRVVVETRRRSGCLAFEPGVPNAQVCEGLDAEGVRRILWESWTKLVEENER